MQTFPDVYRFYGTYEQISAQIGNAVPVRLAEVFARYFSELLERQESYTCHGVAGHVSGVFHKATVTENAAKSCLILSEPA